MIIKNKKSKMKINKNQKKQYKITIKNNKTIPKKVYKTNNTNKANNKSNQLLHINKKIPNNNKV
jgi:hypothetical protein